MLTTLESNSGTGTAIGIEIIVPLLVEKFGIELDKTTWIDHDPTEKYNEHFCLIHINCRNGEVVDAGWDVRMSRGDAEYLIGQELIDEKHAVAV